MCNTKHGFVPASFLHLTSCEDEGSFGNCFDPKTQRCDGVFQCLNGNDEKGCRGGNK